MRPRRHYIPALFLSLALNLAAQNDQRLNSGPARPAANPAEPLSLLGLGLRDAVDVMGLPDGLAVARGAEPWQDDVVFVYPNGISLFWFGGRVWQVRISGDRGPSMGDLALGQSLDKLVSVFGQPERESEGAYVFTLPPRAFPLRMRAVVKDGTVREIYLYRADF